MSHSDSGVSPLKKFLIGCAVVTAVLALLLIGGGIFVGKWFASQLPDTDRVESFEQQMADRFGPVSDFVPPADGVYDPSRVAIFVDLRERIVDLGRPVAEGYDELGRGDRVGGRSLSGIISGARWTMRLLRNSLEYVAVVDSVLLDAGMGRGEFTHYQLLLLHGYLDVDPEALLEPLQQRPEEDDARKVIEKLVREFGDEARRSFESQLRLARSVADARTHPEWVARLEAALRESGDDESFPLSDPLPPSLRAAFDTHDDRLEATRPRTIGEWLRDLSATLEIETDDDGGVQIRLGD